MRFNTASLLVASSFFCIGSSLPFFGHRRSLPPRATYSVVPVDGGSAASTNTAGQGEVTIIKTIIQTPSPATQTIVKTDTLPPTTEVIIRTQTVEGPKTTQTIDITITPTLAPVTITVTEYSVIDISAPTTIVLPPIITPSQSSISSSATKTALSTASSIPDDASQSITKTSITSSTRFSTGMTSTLETSYISSATQVISSAATSTTSYDNGQWHTTYPSWSNGTAILSTVATPVQTLSPQNSGVNSPERRFKGVSELLRFFRRDSVTFR